MPSAPIISTHDLTKVFRGPRGEPVRAVSGITVDVEPGTLTAFLGPNGAGKSTTMRMLTTLLTPTSGSARVCGCDVALEPAAVRTRIGYVGQRHGASQNQRVRDELLAQGALFGLPAAPVRRRVDDLVEALDLGSFADRQVLTLSGGQRRRVDIALGLVPSPRLLVLDEPTTGLDPHSRANLWEHITRLRAEEEISVLLTTHYLEEADQYAERVLVIDAGRVVADGTSPELKAGLVGDRVHLEIGEAQLALAREVLARAGHEVDGPDAAQTDGRTLTLTVPDSARAVPPVLAALAGAGVGVLAATTSRPTLDDVFLALTGRSLRDGEQPTTDPIPTGGPR